MMDAAGYFKRNLSSRVWHDSRLKHFCVQSVFNLWLIKGRCQTVFTLNLLPLPSLAENSLIKIES
jgi:hypothetical protein